MTRADLRVPPEPAPDNADAALFGVEQRISELRAEWDRLPEMEEDDLRHGLLDQIIDLDVMVLQTPVKTMAGAVYVLRRLADPILGVAVNRTATELHPNAVRHVLTVVEREATMSVGDGMSATEDTALIRAEREFHASVATTEQWSADNPDKSLEDNPEWTRCQELYDHVLAYVPAGPAGAAAILRVLLYRDWCVHAGAPDNIGDILAHVLRAFGREAQTPPQLDPVLALLGELEETNDAARRNSEAWDAAVTEGFPDYAEIGPGKRWATANDLPEDLLKRFNAATGSDRALAIDKEDAAIVDRQNDIEDRIIATRGCSPAGALVKLRAAVGLWERRAGEPELPAWDNLDRNEKLVVSAMRDLECVTGERPAS